jgi:hypothetical protein
LICEDTQKAVKTKKREKRKQNSQSATSELESTYPLQKSHEHTILLDKDATIRDKC